MLEFHCVYNTIFAACPVAVSIALSHLLWCDSMSSADHTHLSLHWVGAGSQLRLPQATGPCCAQVKQVIGFPIYALPPPSPPYHRNCLGDYISTAKLCKQFRLREKDNIERRTAVQRSSELTISCHWKTET